MKLINLVVITVLSVFFFNLNTTMAQNIEKVILDTDMVDAFDDGIAMVLLANSPKIDLLGVTVLSGNSWVEDGVASSLRQLEIEGQDKIPVAAGLTYPFRPQRHELFELERQSLGRGHDLWVGSFGLPKPESWQAAYKKNYGKNPVYKPIEQHAVDFIIDAVRANPNQVTIAAIGPCGNLAMAIRKAPDIIPLIKKVVYMGGSFFKPGNTTPAAEFNWYFDPEAAKMTVRAPFKEQIVVGLDVCEKVLIKREQYDRLIKTMGKSEQAQLLRSSFVGQSFAKDPKFTFFVWDVIVAAIIINPSLVTKDVTAFIDINTDFGLSYGQSLAYPQLGPKGTQSAKIVMEINEKGFWDLLNDKTHWKSTK